MTDAEIHRAYLATLLSVLDGDCDQRVHELLCRDDNPHFALQVAHHAAHKMVASINTDDHHEMRADIAEELHALAAEDA